MDAVDEFPGDGSGTEGLQDEPLNQEQFGRNLSTIKSQ